MTSCAHHIYDLLPASDPVPRTILVNVSNAKTILWPLLHALGTTWPEFKQQLAALCDRYTTLEYYYEPKVRFTYSLIFNMRNHVVGRSHRSCSQPTKE